MKGGNKKARRFFYIWKRGRDTVDEPALKRATEEVRGRDSVLPPIHLM